MKKRLHLLILTTVIFAYGYAQTNTFPASGNVGIGTTAPTYKLDVNGSIRASGDAASVAYWVADGKAIRNTNTANGTGVIYFDASNVYIRRADNGASLLSVLSDGKVGIGTASPLAKLHLKNGQLMASDPTGDNINVRLDGTSIPVLRFTRWTGIASIQHNAFVGQYYNPALDEYSFGIGIGSSTSGNQNTATTAITATLAGNVGIGTATPGPYKLAVEGTIGTRRLKVTQVTPWADYVFEPSYQLPPLQEVEAYIKQHKHLPGVPSAKEVEKEGLDVGENQAILLKKIEELTLYMIELKKDLEIERATNKEQNKIILEQQQQLQKINTTVETKTGSEE